MDLGSITLQLFERVKTITKPGEIFESERSNIEYASEEFKKQFARGKTEGPATIEKFEDAAKLYMELSGYKIENGDKSRYASLMIDWLGGENSQNYAEVIEAIRMDDRDDIVKFFKDAYISNSMNSEARSIRRLILSLPGEAKEAIGNKFKNLLDNDSSLGLDVYKILENITGYIDSVTRKNRMIQNFSYK